MDFRKNKTSQRGRTQAADSGLHPNAQTEARRGSACVFPPGKSYHSRLLQPGAASARFKVPPISRRAEGYTNQQTLLVKRECWMGNQKRERVGQIRRRSSEFCRGTKLFVRNAQVEGLFAECTMSKHNGPFDTLAYFSQSRAGKGKRRESFSARQHFHSLGLSVDVGVSILMHKNTTNTQKWVRRRREKQIGPQWLHLWKHNLIEVIQPFARKLLAKILALAPKKSCTMLIETNTSHYLEL